MLMMIERKILQGIENSPNICEFVADTFTEKNHLIEHMYKCNKVKHAQ
jgi:hypothetical protein